MYYINKITAIISYIYALTVSFKHLVWQSIHIKFDTEGQNQKVLLDIIVCIATFAQQQEISAGH